MRKWLVGVLSSIIALELVACGGNEATVEETVVPDEVVEESNVAEGEETIIEEIADKVEDTLSGYVVGGTIKFGKYEQDGDLSNGKEDIEWQILSIEGNTALVISKYALDSKRYNTEFTEVTWETCSLRKWLNEDFLNEAFSEDEQKSINLVTIKNNDNPKYGIPGGNDTEDRIFLLSIEEAQTYFGDYTYYDEEGEWGNIPAIVCYPSTYLIENDLLGMVISEEDYENKYKQKGYSEDIIGKPLTHWWLRSPGSTSCFANSILADGRVSVKWDLTVDCDNVTVRPVMYINFE